MTKPNGKTGRFDYQEVVLVLSCAFVMLVLWTVSDLLDDSYALITLPIIALTIYGTLTEIIGKRKSLFSSTTLVVPVLVPVLLFWTYLIMVLDGQTYSQRMVGAIVCIVCYTMLGFYGVRNRSNVFRSAICVILVVATSAVLFDKLHNIVHFYEFQKEFNDQMKPNLNQKSSSNQSLQTTPIRCAALRV